MGGNSACMGYGPPPSPPMLGSPRCFKDVSSLFQPNFKGFLGRFKGVSRKFQWCLEEVSRAFQRSYLDFF